MPDLVCRALGADELDLFHRYGPGPTSGVGARSRTFDEYVAIGDYRPEWIWVAQRGDDVLARAVFWAPPEFAQPFHLEWFDPGSDIEIGARLLRACYEALVGPDYATPPHPDGGRPDYQLFLPADWRERPEAHADACDRIKAAELAGLRFFTERLTLRWNADDGLPVRSGRLRFAPAVDDRRLTDVIARTYTGTLDAYGATDAARLGADRAAADLLDEVTGMPGGRQWWRLAHDRDGELVGLVLPTRNPGSATIGYLGVVPEHRGQGYVDDLVAEALHLFARAGEPAAEDTTEVGNRPMAGAFIRAGYRVAGRRVILV
ncbi:GNAT family N-acetyltransferase [Nonomuraea sp. NPDC004186]